MVKFHVISRYIMNVFHVIPMFNAKNRHAWYPEICQCTRLQNPGTSVGFSVVIFTNITIYVWASNNQTHVDSIARQIVAKCCIGMVWYTSFDTWSGNWCRTSITTKLCVKWLSNFVGMNLWVKYHHTGFEWSHTLANFVELRACHSIR